MGARIERNVPVSMRDGVTLRADVWFPDVPGRWPVLLQRLPYDKSSCFSSIHLAGLEPLRAVEAGYAVAIQDTRGRFESEGEFAAFRHEAEDGFDTIAWASALPFANGQVGMYGLSYFGANQLLAASLRPPALAAITPQMTAGEFYEHWTYEGGAFQLGFALWWAMSFLAPAELVRREAAGEDLQEVGEELERLLERPEESYDRLPLVDQPVLNELVPSYREWLLHPSRDEYWRATAVSERYRDIDIPGLHIGGWYDLFVDGTLRNFSELTTETEGKNAFGQQELIIGPWAHGVPYDSLGDVHFGPRASQFSLDMTDVHLRWFDRFLRSTETPLAKRSESPVKLFVMGTNQWRREETWPPTGTRCFELFLRSSTRGRYTECSLSRESPRAEEKPDVYVYDPADPTPTVGGNTYFPGVLVGKNAGPRDQRTLASRSDVLTYTGSPLSVATEVTGVPAVELYVSSSAIDTDFTARLVDVFPDGGIALGITDGICRMRYRNGYEHPELLRPGEICLLKLELTATSYVFSKGHRIQLLIASANYPRFDRNPNSGGICAFATSTDWVPARQAIYHDAARSSLLRLPIRGVHESSGLLA